MTLFRSNESSSSLFYNCWFCFFVKYHFIILLDSIIIMTSDHVNHVDITPIQFTFTFVDSTIKSQNTSMTTTQIVFDKLKNNPDFVIEFEFQDSNQSHQT